MLQEISQTLNWLPEPQSLHCCVPPIGSSSVRQKSAVTKTRVCKRFAGHVASRDRLTQHVNLEIAASRISSLIVGHVADVVSAPEQSLSGPVSILLLHLGDVDVIAETRLVPGHNGRAVLRNHPEITRAGFHLGWDLVSLELLTLVTAVTRRADSLSAVRRHDPLDTTHSLVVPGPCQYQALIEHRFRSAIAHLLLNLVGHVQRAAPHLHLGQVALKAGSRVTFFALWRAQQRPGASTEAKISMSVEEEEIDVEERTLTKVGGICRCRSP